jgi:dihydroorotate dehydrogenase
MGRSVYEWLGPLVRTVPSEWAHELGLLSLRAPLRWGGATVSDPFEWRGHRFRNRVGIAAGLDKNGVALRGLAGLGVGFVELGTVLSRPHAGNTLRPRVRRLPRERALWNRLGFPSHGVARVRDRLARTPLTDVALAVNLAPHPLTVKSADVEPGFAARVRAELFEIARLLHPWAAFFVLNASSPNTPGLRRQLEGSGFAHEIVAPLRAELLHLDAAARRLTPTLLLVKLPPEDADGKPLGPEGLTRLLQPLCAPDVCDGFVAVNTSVSLARTALHFAADEPPGGISGAPLRPLSLEAMQALAGLAPDQLRIGVGGVMDPADAQALVGAGAHLVELYSGLIYRGPRLVRDCAAALRDAGASASDAKGTSPS